MKKAVLLLLVVLILSSLIVSALDLPGGVNLRTGAEQFVELVKDIATPVFSVFLGGDGEILFQRILFFFVILAIVYVVLDKVPIFEDKPGVTWVVVIAVSLLSTRFLSDAEIVKSILLPYTVVGIVLASAIPLVIAFVFIESFESGVLRRILWSLFLVIFFAIWLTRTGEVGSLAIIYFFTGVAALIFLFADGTIRRIMINQQMKQLGMDNRSQFETDIRRQIRQVGADLSLGIITPSQAAYSKRRLQKKLKALNKL